MEKVIEKLTTRNTHAPSWLHSTCNGLYRGDTVELLYEGKHYSLIKFPGYTSWSGLGSQSYGRTQYIIVENGDALIRGKYVHEGRLNKELKKKFIKQVLAMDAAKEK